VTGRYVRARLGQSGSGTNYLSFAEVQVWSAGLYATSGNAQVMLRWPAVGDATGYTILRSTTSGSSYVSVGSVAGQWWGGTFTDTGLTNGATYYYVVAATNSGGSSPNSAQVATTPIAPPAAAPTSLAISGGSLSWTGVAGATAYTVKRSAIGGTLATIATVGQASYSDTGAAAGLQYAVTAINAGGESGNSNLVYTCSSSNCPNGCCSNNTCIPQGLSTGCVTGGASCGTACSTTYSNTCSSSGCSFNCTLCVCGQCGFDGIGVRCRAPTCQRGYVYDADTCRCIPNF